MPFAVLIDLPEMTQRRYDDVCHLLALDDGLPSGCLFHSAGSFRQGWRIFELWDSPEAFRPFHERLTAVCRSVGIEPVEPGLWEVEHQAGRPDAGSTAMPPKTPVEAPSWLTPRVIEALHRAGLRSIPSRDVPAAAAIVYRGNVIVGWNDVAATGNPAGHADVNAVTNAIRHFGGAERFKRLDRDDLYLVTTYEPCPMCEAVLAGEHGLKPENVYVLMLKEEIHRNDERNRCGHLRRGWRYVARDDVQQKLFCLHPGYRKAFPERCREQ